MKLLVVILLLAILGSVISRPPPNRRKINTFLDKMNYVIRHKRQTVDNPKKCPPKKVYNPETKTCEKISGTNIGLACCLGGLGK